MLLEDYRAETFRTRRRITSLEEALAFVEARGFIYFWPIKGVTLPSLWTAVAGDRPVASAHDDPGHVTWGWKDAMLGTRKWYYAKVLRKKATLISLEIAPYFYALSENYGSIEEDYLEQYADGLLSPEAKAVYEALLDGPLHTVALRQAARLKNYAFGRALEELQADFKILPVGVASAGRWRYAFIYDITARHYPELPARARTITRAGARVKLLERYVRSVGAAPFSDLVKLFGWPKNDLDEAVDVLVCDGLLRRGLELAGKDKWLALDELT